jgi:hypothetical protein
MIPRGTWSVGHRLEKPVTGSKFVESGPCNPAERITQCMIETLKFSLMKGNNKKQRSFMRTTDATPNNERRTSLVPPFPNAATSLNPNYQSRGHSPNQHHNARASGMRHMLNGAVKVHGLHLRSSQVALAVQQMIRPFATVARVQCSDYQVLLRFSIPPKLQHDLWLKKI